MTLSLQDPYDSLENEAFLSAIGAAELNQTTIQRLQRALKVNPVVNLLSIISWFYKKRTQSQPHSSNAVIASPTGNFKGKPPRRLSFCAEVASRAGKATIVSPLSSGATILLGKYADTPTDPAQSLLLSLKQMIPNSENYGNFQQESCLNATRNL